MLPALKRDWVGRRVRLLRQVVTKGGVIFEAGEVMVVTRSFGGLHLEAVALCRHCGRGRRESVKGIHENAVELLPA